MSQVTPTDAEADTYAISYIKYNDQTKAFLTAFPKSKAAKNTLYVSASIFHKKHKVNIRISQLQQIAKKTAEETALKEKEGREKEFSISVVFLQKALANIIKLGLKKKKDQQGNDVPFSLSSAKEAIAEINRMNGNHAETKLKIGGDPENPIQPIQPILSITRTVVDK